MDNTVWKKIYEMLKLLTGEVDVAHKGDLQAQVDTLSDTVNDCFTSVSDGKRNVANAITGKGVSTAPDATFATMAANVEKIKTEPTLQSKSEALHTGKTSVIMIPDSGYDGLSRASATITLQEKTAALSTAAQEILPDSGKVLSKVNVPAIEGNAGTEDVLSGKVFNSAAGINKIGTMPNRGAWTGETTGSGNVIIPTGYHNGEGYVSGKGAYDKGVSDADARVNSDSANYKGGYNAGVNATKVGTAGEGDVLSGKTFTNENSVGLTGTIPVYSGGQGPLRDTNYVYASQPYLCIIVTNVGYEAAYYGSGSMVRVPLTVLGDATAADVLSGKTFTSSAGKAVSGTISSKAAATYTPGTSDQTIASGQYLSGAQTISGDANLVASNIKSGVSIFGVSGTYKGGSSLSFTLRAAASNGNAAGTSFDLSGQVTIDNTSGTYTTAKCSGTACTVNGKTLSSGSSMSLSKASLVFKISQHYDSGTSGYKEFNEAVATTITLS